MFETVRGLRTLMWLMRIACQCNKQSFHGLRHVQVHAEVSRKRKFWESRLSLGPVSGKAILPTMTCCREINNICLECI